MTELIKSKYINKKAGEDEIKVRLKEEITEMYEGFRYMVGKIGIVDVEMAEHVPKEDKPFYNPYKYGWDATEGVWVKFDEGLYLIPCKYLDVLVQTSVEYELVLMISTFGANGQISRNDVKLKDSARTRTYASLSTFEIGTLLFFELNNYLFDGEGCRTHE